MSANHSVLRRRPGLWFCNCPSRSLSRNYLLMTFRTVAGFDKNWCWLLAWPPPMLIISSHKLFSPLMMWFWHYHANHVSRLAVCLVSGSAQLFLKVEARASLPFQRIFPWHMGFKNFTLIHTVYSNSAWLPLLSSISSSSIFPAYFKLIYLPVESNLILVFSNHVEL